MSIVRESSSDLLIIDLGNEMNTISTAGCPKVYESIRYIVFKRVPKDFNVVDLDRYCNSAIRGLGLDYEKATVFLTAVDLTTYVYEKYEGRGITVEAYATVGIEHPTCLPRSGDPLKSGGVGTINIAVITNKPLGRVGLVDLFRLVSEIKGVLIGFGSPHCITSPSLGTASDATVVAAPEGNEKFSGPVTELGSVVSSILLRLMSGVFRRSAPRDYIIKSLGLEHLEELISLSMKIYKQAPIPGVSDSAIKEELLGEYDRVLSDPNIVLLIRGSRLLEVAVGAGLVPGISYGEYYEDTAGIVVDELLGKSLAEYINGFKGLLAYYWIERLKEGGVEDIRRLPPLTDDLLASLIGGVLSRIYDKYTRR